MANEKRLDLIDRNNLENEIKRLEVGNSSLIGKIILSTISTVIKMMPTVDAVEVVHGHWYKAPHHPYRCSNCGEMALLDMYGESHYRSNYCPNCGAKMDGGNVDG